MAPTVTTARRRGNDVSGKRARSASADVDDEDKRISAASHESDASGDEGSENSFAGQSSDGNDESSDSDSGRDTEDEIDAARNTKSKKTLKRKRRATSPSRFGATLKNLLSTEAPSTNPLSLKPSISRKKNDEKLDLKATKVLQEEKKDVEEKNHIKDIIGGWGGESERALRKVAQRGVVKLFNVVQQAQLAAAAGQEKAKEMRGSGKPTLPAPSAESSNKRKKKAKDNLLGQNPAALSQDNFLRFIKSDNVVSKA